MPADDLFELASELLVQAVEVLGDAAPARRVVTVGPPALDCCDQLAVHVAGVNLIQMGPGEAMARGVACMTVTEAPLRVTLTGCWPGSASDGNPPTASAINTSAVGLYAHAWTMWCGLRNRQRAGLLFADGQPRRVINVGALAPVEPQGGCAGWTLDVAVQLDPDPALGLEGS